MVSEEHLDIPDVYEPEVANVIEHFVGPGDCAIDVGASIGYFTVMLGKLVGESGIVLAFEPNLKSFEHLVRNVHLVHKLNNVACYKHALWKCDCPALELWSPSEIGYSCMFHINAEAHESEIVEGRALDTLLINEMDQPRFIKIDCEGTEAEVLFGARKILERGVDCVVMEFNYHILQMTGRTDRHIREYMAQLGYEMFLISISDGNGGYCAPIKVDLEQTIQLSGGHYFNVMFSTQEKVDQLW